MRAFEGLCLLFSSRIRHTRSLCDWSSGVCSSDLDEKFLATLSSRVRPVCIFDSRGTIEADLGGGEYIQDIQVTPLPATRSEERRVGKEGRSRWSPYH